MRALNEKPVSTEAFLSQFKPIFFENFIENLEIIGTPFLLRFIIYAKVQEENIKYIYVRTYVEEIKK